MCDAFQLPLGDVRILACRSGKALGSLREVQSIHYCCKGVIDFVRDRGGHAPYRCQFFNTNQRLLRLCGRQYFNLQLCVQIFRLCSKVILVY